MIKNAKKPTLIAHTEAWVGSPHSASHNKARANVGSSNSRSIASRLLSAKAPNPRRAKQTPSTESQVTIHTKAGNQSANVHGLYELPKDAEDLELIIRSALSRSGRRRTKSPASVARSSKSVKFDPAVVFCSDLDNAASASTEDVRFQAGLEAILKCEKRERERLQHVLNALTKPIIEHQKPDTAEEVKRNLNPRASVFGPASSLRGPPPPKSLGAQGFASTSRVALRHRFHPRAALDPNIFEPQPSVQMEQPKLAQSPSNKQIPNSQSPTSFKNPNELYRALGNMPPAPLRSSTRKSFSSRFGGHAILGVFSTVEPQNLQVIVPLEDSGPGREALAIDPTWARAILDNFVQKYPMTGLLTPALAVIRQKQRSAEVQQRLEFILMQKKEMSALACAWATLPLSL